MGESPAPSSAFSRLAEIPPTALELGALKNGLGSIQNLELLLKSIRVGQKGLFAAVAAVHADCAPMIASARSLWEPLTQLGGDAACAQRLTSVFTDTLTELEAVLADAVRTGRLSVGQRLRLEGELSRAARDLCAALRLVGLLERAARPRPAELTPIELVHAGGAERPSGKRVEASVVLPEGCAGSGLGVDLDAAKLMVELAVALVIEGQSERTVQVTFASPAGGDPVTRVTLGAAKGTRVQLGLFGLLGPSLACGEAASRSLGGRFEFSPEAHRACIYWPLS
jgi:hypothetical protein